MIIIKLYLSILYILSLCMFDIFQNKKKVKNIKTLSKNMYIINDLLLVGQKEEKEKKEGRRKEKKREDCMFKENFTLLHNTEFFHEAFFHSVTHLCIWSLPITKLLLCVSVLTISQSSYLLSIRYYFQNFHFWFLNLILTDKQILHECPLNKLCSCLFLSAYRN